MYRDIETKVENAVMKERTDENGNVINYTILPQAGYVLHEITLDEIITDENGSETDEIKKGYTSGLVTAMADYDFVKNEREIYAVKEEKE